MDLTVNKSEIVYLNDSSNNRLNFNIDQFCHFSCYHHLSPPPMQMVAEIQLNWTGTEGVIVHLNDTQYTTLI